MDTDHVAATRDRQQRPGGLASEPGTGAAMVIGGVETIVLKGNKFRREPRLWLRNGAAWDRTVLRVSGSSTEGQVNDLNADTLVAGNTPGGATVWSAWAGWLDSGRHRTGGQRCTTPSTVPAH